jgi:PAS domain S-box-containing protein
MEGPPNRATRESGAANLQHAASPDPALRIRQLEAEISRLREQVEGNRQFPAERDLRAILDNMPAMIGYWDHDQRNRFGNHAYLDWFGIDPATMPGCHIRDVLGEARYQLNLPYINAVLGGEFQQFERVIPSPDGKVVRHSLTNYIPDIENGKVLGFYVLVTDITAIKQAEEALRNSEARYREVVDDQTEVISRLRADGTFLFVNEPYCRVFGKTAQELLGSQWMPVCFPDDLAHVQEQLARLVPENPVVVIENRVLTGDGNFCWMQFVNRGVFDSAGQLLEIQSVGRDITDRKQVEEALHKAHELMEQRVVERTEQLRRLAVQTTLAEARERQAIASDLHDNLGQLLHVARIKLDAIEPLLPACPPVNDLHDLLNEASRQVRTLTSQLSPPILKKLGLPAALRWLLDEMKRQYGLTVSFVQDSASITPSDEQGEMLFRIARELLINVVKHSGSLEATLYLTQTDGQIILVVDDQGVGIPDLDHSLNNSDCFGLANIRERITYLNGQIQITSGNVSGLRVDIRLPLATHVVEAGPL